MIFIPTHGRVGRQRTIKWFPKEWYGNLVTLVCVEGEDHGDLPCLRIPEEFSDSISKKRQWILEYGRAKNLDWIMMIDDNVLFSMIDKSISFQEELLKCIEMFLLSSVSVVYFNYRFMHKKRILSCDDITKIQEKYVLATNSYLIKPKEIPEGINFLMPIYEDSHFTLSCMEAGIPIGFYHNIMLDPLTKVGDLGGGNRTDPNFTKVSNIEDSLRKFHEAHKRYSTLKDVEPGAGTRGSSLLLRKRFSMAYRENIKIPDSLESFF